MTGNQDRNVSTSGIVAISSDIALLVFLVSILFESLVGNDLLTSISMTISFIAIGIFGATRFYNIRVFCKHIKQNSCLTEKEKTSWDVYIRIFPFSASTYWYKYIHKKADRDQT